MPRLKVENMVRDIRVHDVVKFKTPEMTKSVLGTVTQVYQITDALDPGIVGNIIYVVEFDSGLCSARIWDDLIIDVYKKAE